MTTTINYPKRFQKRGIFVFTGILDLCKEAFPLHGNRLTPLPMAYKTSIYFKKLKSPDRSPANQNSRDFGDLGIMNPFTLCIPGTHFDHIYYGKVMFPEKYYFLYRWNHHLFHTSSRELSFTVF